MNAYDLVEWLRANTKPTDEIYVQFDLDVAPTKELNRVELFSNPRITNGPIELAPGNSRVSIGEKIVIVAELI